MHPKQPCASVLMIDMTSWGFLEAIFPVLSRLEVILSVHPLHPSWVSISHLYQPWKGVKGVHLKQTCPRFLMIDMISWASPEATLWLLLRDTFAGYLISKVPNFSTVQYCTVQFKYYTIHIQLLTFIQSCLEWSNVFMEFLA